MKDRCRDVLGFLSPASLTSCNGSESDTPKKKAESDSDDVPQGKLENLLDANDANDPTDVPAPAE